MANKIHYNTVATPSTRPSVVFDPNYDFEVETDSGETPVLIRIHGILYEFVGNRPPRVIEE